ncbi:hypothetical protein A3F65_03830 [Candidatus Saccharibacteria bacterium RIFCSPHIGHO2_12_FULL_47_16b]|nr:MAG: hypothetical protein A3F65_03830 [Candidatus Saccharibacteria bacterium RIFCSPHIGHO2_12_FULL_47_16b]
MALGYEVATVSFPRYRAKSSYFIRQYLAGAYGPASEISPYTASLFYAVDRYEAATKISNALKEGKLVLADRYVGSNMAHQGSKFASGGEKRGFFIWAESLEYELLGIPRPDLNIYLHLPIGIANQRIKTRAGLADEHEADEEHLINTIATYELLCSLFPKDFTKINCAKKGHQLAVRQISNSIWKEIKPLLPPNPPNEPKPLTVKLTDDKSTNKNSKEPSKN